MPGVIVKRVFAVALAAAALAVPAYAQQQQKDDEPLVQIEKQKKMDREEVEKQYSRTMQRTSAKGATEAVKVDPWSNMRGPDDPKAKK